MNTSKGRLVNYVNKVHLAQPDILVFPNSTVGMARSGLATSIACTDTLSRDKILSVQQ